MAAALLALLATGCERACGRKPAATATGAQGFATQSQRLATIPPGVEVTDGAFSPEGRSVAIVGSRDGKAQVFHDGKPSKPYDAVDGLTFLAGGAGLAFVGHRAGKAVVVVGGEEGPELDAFGSLVAAPDGRVVYSASRGGKWHLVSGKRELGVASSVDPSPWVSGDGKRLVYVEQQGDTGPTLLHACSLDLTDCTPSPAYDAIGKLSADATDRWLAFPAGRGGRELAVVVDPAKPGFTAREAAGWDAVARVALSEGGELAFLARRGEQQLLLVDDKQLQLPPSESPIDLVVGRGGRTIFTTIADNQVMVLVDGKKLELADLGGVHHPVLSADGAHYAFVAEREDRGRVVVDGLEGPLHDKVVTPRFTADGTRLVYRARQAGERFVVVTDTRGKLLREHPHYAAVFEVRFSPDGKSVGYGVRKGQELWWMVEPL